MSEMERIAELQAEITKTPYNKATQHAVGLLKAQIARLREKAEKKVKGKGGSVGFAVRKSGDATVVIVGFPSVGKSTLLNKITSANSKIGSYDFTTLDVVPGLLEHEGAKIQLLDIPGIVPGASFGKGRGREILSMARSADLILMVLDATNPSQGQIIQEELYQAGFRINKEKPDVKIEKTAKGGLVIDIVKNGQLEKETIQGILKELGVLNAHILIREDINQDELIDVIQGNRMYVPGLLVMNKIDLAKPKINYDIGISAEKDSDLTRLKKLIFKKLNLIRIYCKEVGKKADFEEALIIKKGNTVGDVCKKLHREFLNKFRFVRIWGSSKFPGQRFGLEYQLKDKDVIEIHLR